MLDVRPALARFGISTTSAMQAVQQVRIHIEDAGETHRIERTNELLEKVLGVRLNPVDINNKPVGTPYAYAMTIAQAAVESVIKQEGQIDNVEELMTNAVKRADKFITTPKHKWLFAVAEGTSVATTDVAVAAGVELKVAVKADGKIKKGGKELLAAELYKKYVASLNGAPYANQAFIAILVKELGMTKDGASTYNYNMKKKHGGQIVPKGTK